MKASCHLLPEVSKRDMSRFYFQPPLIRIPTDKHGGLPLLLLIILGHRILSTTATIQVTTSGRGNENDESFFIGKMGLSLTSSPEMPLHKGLEAREGYVRTLTQGSPMGHLWVTFLLSLKLLRI